MLLYIGQTQLTQITEMKSKS